MKEFIEKLIGRLEEREAELKNITAECKPTKEIRDKNYGYYTAMNHAKEIVNQLVEEYKGGWIPYNDKLPPQPKENPVFDNKPLELYLVSDGYSDYPFRAFWNGKFFVDGFSSVDVIAWQPLPAPYQPKGE